MKEILWTIQTEAAFEIFQNHGVLRADPSHLPSDGDFQNAYRWMASQMGWRIGPPPSGVQYPVWAWYQWEGKRKRRDLRLAGYARRGTPMVQITFEADTRDFLLSDFDAWHLVLSNHYIADGKEDWDRFYANNGDSRTVETVASWDKVFDLKRYIPSWDPAPDRRTLQAVLWEVRMSQVIKVEHFLAR